MTAKIELKTASGGKVILDPQDTAVDQTLVLPATSGTIQTSGATLTTSANLTFTGTGNRITGDFSNSTPANRVMFQNSVTNAQTLVGIIPNGTAVNSRIQFFNSSSPGSGTNSIFDLGVIGSTDVRLQATYEGSGTPLPMTFYTGGSERVRIDTSGNVGIGTSSPTRRLDVIQDVEYQFRVGTSASNSYDIGRNPTDGLFYFYGNQSGANGYVFSGANGERARITSGGRFLVGVSTNIAVDATTTAGFQVNRVVGLCEISRNNADCLALQRSGTDGEVLTFWKNTTKVGNVSITGSATSYATSSDYRLKEQVTPMTGALAKNELLNPVTYKWKADGSDGQGFIAHELQAVFPDAVTGEKDAVDDEGNPQYQGVDTSFLVGHLVACIKELKSELDSVKAELAAMKGSE